MNSQEIIENTLALNLFKPSNKRANFFIVGGNGFYTQECLFTADVPFHFLQYICLALSLSEHFPELSDFIKRAPHSKETIVDLYNENKIGLSSFCVLNCRRDDIIGAFCNYWMTQKVVKNTAICYFSRFTYENRSEQFAIRYSMFNKKFQAFEDDKRKINMLPNYKSKENIKLLMEFSKLWLVKK